MTTTLRPIQSGTISFGLVNIPVKVYAAGDSAAKISMNQIHAEKKTRLKQQMYDPATGEVVPKEKIAKGYEFMKDQYVIVTEEELTALEAASSKQMAVSEFVPLDSVAPTYFDSIYYLGPDKGAERAFRLLTMALKDTKRAAIVQYTARSREHVALIQPLGDGLMLQNLRYADEVRDQSEVSCPEAQVSSAEVSLAKQLIEAQSTSTFDPKKYKDHYREKLKHLIDQKVSGVETPFTPIPQVAQQPVVDLMETLKASLAKVVPPPPPPALPTPKTEAKPAAKKAAPKKKKTA